VNVGCSAAAARRGEVCAAATAAEAGGGASADEPCRRLQGAGAAGPGPIAWSNTGQNTGQNARAAGPGPIACEAVGANQLGTQAPLAWATMEPAPAACDAGRALITLAGSGASGKTPLSTSQSAIFGRVRVNALAESGGPGNSLRAFTQQLLIRDIWASTLNESGDSYAGPTAGRAALNPCVHSQRAVNRGARATICSPPGPPQRIAGSPPGAQRLPAAPSPPVFETPNSAFHDAWGKCRKGGLLHARRAGASAIGFKTARRSSISSALRVP
jgi:hypothetical protein